MRRGEVYEELLQITIPPIIISLVFASGVFYRRVNDLETLTGDLNDKQKENSAKISVINESLVEIRSELKNLSKSQEEFRREIRTSLSKKN